MSMSAPTSRATPLSAYQRKLFVFLGVATFFEGFDYIALSQILPSLREEFALSKAEASSMVAVIGFGAVLAYGLIRHADVVGRRRVLSYTIVGYTLFSLLSAVAQDAWQFGAAQLFARMFLLAEYAVSMVYLAEEFPADRRAFAVGVIQGMSSLGCVVCAGVVPLLLRTPIGYRSVFLVGALPLCIVIWLRRNVRETARFAEMTGREAQPVKSLFRIFRSPYKKRIPLLASIWALTYLCTNVVVTFWKDFAVTERGFTDEQVALALMIAALCSLPLVFASGKLLDVLGRKGGAVVIFTTTSGATLLAYLAHGFWPLTLGLTGGIFAASAVLPVLTSFTLELFPTELRADAFAWSNNLLGRTGYVLGPWLVGLWVGTHGYGLSVAATSIFPFIALVLILTGLPETRGKELEESCAL
jgi:MFS transporter, putative metabolite:H+ symporter